MPQFEPVSPPQHVYLADGSGVRIFGWWSADDWATVEPFIGNPDGFGAGPWHRYYGEDPWELK